MSGAEIAIAVIAITAGALVKAISGLGLPIVAIPVMALFIPLEDAVVVMAIPSVISNLVMSYRARSSYPETVDLPVLALSGLIAAMAGSALLIWLPEEVLLAGVALTVLVYVVVSLIAVDLRVSDATRRWLSPTVGVTAGLMHGATGISGPIYGTYVHALRQPPTAYILSVTSLFGIAGIGQLIVLTATGLFTTNTLLAAMAALVPVLAVIPFGSSIRDKMSGDRFDRLVLLVLATAAAAIVVQLVF